MTQQNSNFRISPSITIAESALHFRFSRSGGPGGQNVNKLNTKAELRLRPEDLQGLHPRGLTRLKATAKQYLLASGEVQIVLNTERTQEGNRRACLKRLCAIVIAAEREPKRRYKTRPTRGSVERRIQEKTSRSQIKRQRRPTHDF